MRPNLCRNCLVETRRLNIEAFTKLLENKQSPSSMRCTVFAPPAVAARWWLIRQRSACVGDCGAGARLLTPGQEQETTSCNSSLKVHSKFLSSALSPQFPGTLFDRGTNLYLIHFSISSPGERSSCACPRLSLHTLTSACRPL